MGAPLAFWNEFHYLVNVTTLVARARGVQKFGRAVEMVCLQEDRIFAPHAFRLGTRETPKGAGAVLRESRTPNRRCHRRSRTGTAFD
jgi:hypothetical protein